MYVVVQSLVICYSAEKWAKKKLREAVELVVACCERRRKLQKSGQNNKHNYVNRISIDGLADMEIRVHIKFTFDT